MPKKKYLECISLDSIFQKQNVILVRRIDKNQKNTFNNLGFLRSDALESKELPFLSINLLGGRFNSLIHSKYRIKGVSMQKWKQSNKVNPLNAIKDIEILHEFSNAYIDARNIHNQTIPYTRTVDKNSKAEINKYFESFGKPTIEEGRYNLQAQIKFLHDPLNINYWHVELNIYSYDVTTEKMIKSASSNAYSKEVCQNILNDIFCVNCYSKIEHIEDIDEMFYLKNKSA